MEQAMIKVISGMPSAVQDRFKILHMLSDERSKANDEMEREHDAMTLKYELKKKPFLELRNKIVLGEHTDFKEFLKKYDQSVPELEIIVAGIVKPVKKENESDSEYEKPHVVTDVSHLKTVVGIPDFWVQAVKANQNLMQAIRKKDEDVIQCITNVTATRTED